MSVKQVLREMNACPQCKGYMKEWAILCDVEKCIYCRKKIRLVVPMPKDVKSTVEQRLNKNYLWHIWETHGIPEDLFIMQI